MNAEQMGALFFEVSEFERGKVDLVCRALTFLEDQLAVVVGENEVTLYSGDDRNLLCKQLRELGAAVMPPHCGELPDIDVSDSHCEWGEVLRALSYGPEDLVRIGFGTLAGTSTDRETSPDRYRTRWPVSISV